MFAAKNAHSFFPTMVWAFDLPAAEAKELNGRMMPVLERMRSEISGSSAGRTRQSNTDLQEAPEFAGLCRRMIAAGGEIVDFLGLQRHPLFVSGCWANFGGANTTHHEHSHANNFLSAVYYVQAEAGANTINFIDPRAQAHVIAPPVVRPSVMTASQALLEIEPGRLVLFPAWLRHSVDPNTSGKDRISIAANLMFEQFSERLARPRFNSNQAKNRQRRSGAR